MDLLRAATIARMSLLHLYNCRHAICRPRRCKKAGSRNIATSGPAASRSGVSHTFCPPSLLLSHTCAVSCACALSLTRVHYFVLACALPSLSFVLSEYLSPSSARARSRARACSLSPSLSLSLSLSLSPTHTPWYTQTHICATHREVLSVYLSPQVSPSLSFFLSHAHTHMHREMLASGDIPFFFLTSVSEIIAHVCGGGTLPRKFRCEN